MSYPSGPPGNSGYQSGPQAPQYGSPSPQYGAPQEAVPAGPSKLPVYLAAAVAALGIFVYLASFGPVFTISAPNVPGFGPVGGEDVSGTPIGVTLATSVALVAGLLAGVSLLPKQGKHHVWAAILSVLGLLLLLTQIVGVPSPVSFGWALYLIIVFTVLQALAAIAALLLEADVITAPTPRPKQYEQPYGGQYGAPGGYYGQPQGQQDYGQPQHGGPPQGPGQRPGYTQATQYGGYSGAPTTGGFPALGGQGNAPTAVHNVGQNHHAAENGPPTPPTGFPAFGQPQQTGSTPTGSSETTALTKAFDAQQPQQQGAPPSAPPPS